MTALLFARNQNHADEPIAELVRECAEGKSDREAEALALATLWRIDEGSVSERFTEAREALRERDPEPKLAEPLARPPEDDWGAKVARAKARMNKGPLQIEAALEVSGAPAAQPNDFSAQLNEAIAQQAKPQTEPELEPEAPLPKAGLPAVIPQAPPLVPQPTLDDVLTRMNSLHAILNNVGGKTVIGCWEQSDDGYERLAFHGQDSFRLRYSNAVITIDVPDGHGGLRKATTGLALWWLNHRDRAQYRGVKFRPNQARVVDGYLNLWRDWGVEVVPGDWSFLRRHIDEVVADGNGEFAEYVLRWIAWTIQNPDKQAEVALVLIGEKGTGKGTLARCLQPIFGAHALQITDREQVIGKFNGHLEDCILFIADEAYWGGDKRCVGRLQGMITEPTLSIERKGFDAYPAKNFLHILMLAEPGWVIPAGRYERRYAALKVSDKRRGDRDYFKALNRQMAEGGIEAMFHDLQNVELGEWHPREIPEALLRSGALTEQQTLTLPPWEQWYLSLLRDGKLPEALNKKPNTAYTTALLDSVKERIPRLKFDATDIALADFLRGKACNKYRDKSFNGWSFPPLGIARSEWDKANGAQKWDNPEAEWGDKVEAQ